MAPNGVKAYVTASDRVTPVNLHTDRAYHSLIFGGDTGPVETAVAPDGRTVYVLTINERGGGDIVPFDAATEVQGRSIPVGRNPQSIVVSPLSSWGLVVAGGAVQVFSLVTNRVVATINVGGTPGEVAFSPNGLMAYVLDRGNVIPINMSTLTREPTIHVGGVIVDIGLGAIAFSPDSDTAYVSNYESNIVTCIDLVTARLSCSFRLPQSTEPDYMAVTPDGRQLFVVGTGAGTVGAVDLATHRVTSTVVLSGAPGGIVIAP
jgi:YVTN family beta-propeller protein